ncbi:hypothetical protein D3C85_1546810 [compost metagenome]
MAKVAKQARPVRQPKLSASQPPRGQNRLVASPPNRVICTIARRASCPRIAARVAKAAS